MNTSTVSEPALQLIELMQLDAGLRTIAEGSPELFANLIQAAEVAAKMSYGRSQLIAGITRAADAIILRQRGADSLLCATNSEDAVNGGGSRIPSFTCSAIRRSYSLH